MKARFLMVAATVAALAALLAPSASVAAVTEVGVDDVGDWGATVDPGVAPVGDALGQDLLSAALEPTTNGINFVIRVTALPESGGVPEGSRYTWDMLVDNKFLELDGKFTNYSRGTCDPTAGTCPPPRDPGAAPFAVRGNCTTVQSVTTCQELGLVHATFDPATDSITIPVTYALLGGDACSVIMGGTNIFGGSISAAPSAFFTSSAMPLDTMYVDGVLDPNCP